MARLSKYFLSLALCLSFQSFQSVYAGNELPFNQQLNDLIFEKFVSEEQGLTENEKLHAYDESIHLRMGQIENNIRSYLVKYQGEEKKKVRKELKEEKVLIIYRQILKHTEELRRTSDPIEFSKISQRILELDYATKVEGTRTGLMSQVDYVRNNLKKWYIHKTNAPEGEASNLYNPSNGLFYSSEELNEMKGQGIDLSILNPPDKDSFWTNRRIEDLELEDVYTGGNHRMYEGVDLRFPDNKKCHFHKVRKTQSKPKVDVKCKIKGKDKKVKFKLKFGSEMHSEITSASLISLLGFNHDPSKYYRDFKVVFPKGMKLKKFFQEYESYFDGTKYPIESYIKEKGVDKKGRDYIVFYEVLVEKKPKELFRAGPWAWGETGHRGNRAARGMLLFNMWVANLDLKEAENNKLVLKYKENGDYDMFHYQHDMGFAFGNSFREKPNAYKWNIVKSVTDTAIHLNFSNFQNNTGFEHVTYSDAKWMVRLISRLSRKQIADAVRLGGWPQEINLLLTEKLISRRNDLVKAFDLSDEISEIPFDRNISSENGILNRGNLVRTNFEGYTQDFGRELFYLLSPVYEGLENMAVKGAQGALGVFDQYDFTGEDLGFDLDIVGKVEVKFKRKVVHNPAPKGDNDSYLVEDKMEVRFGLGAGVVFRGMSYYIKNYTLIYPVRTRHEGNLANNSIVNFLLPYHVRNGNLPDKYVLIVEDGIEALAEVEVSQPVVMPAELEVEGGYGRLGRAVISSKDGEFQIYEDHTSYHRLAAKLNAKLFILRLPIFKWNYMKGFLNRDAHKVKYKEDNYDEAMIALDDFILYGSLASVEKMSEKEEIQSNYVLRDFGMSFFGIVGFRNKKRVDDIVHTIYEDEVAKDVIKKFQIRQSKKSDWFFAGDGEEKEKIVTFVGQEVESEIINPIIHLQIDLNDVHTYTDELAQQYLNFISVSSNNPKFIDFNPEIHTKNHLWGNTEILVDFLYSQVALEKLMSTEQSLLWEYFRESTGWSEKEIRTYKSHQNYGKSNGRRKRYMRERYLIRRFESVLRKIRNAKNSKNDKAKYTLLTDAIFKSTYKSRGSYNPHIIGVINRVIGSEDRFMSAYIAQKEGHENKYPARTPLYNEVGRDVELFQTYYDFEFENPKWIWKMFDLQ